MLRRGYGISEKTGARFARGSKTASSPAKEYDTIFESKLKFGLRFSIFRLLKEVIDHYEVSITQL